MSKFKFDNLDSIRTIAFFCVFLMHAFSSTVESVINDPIFQFANSFREFFNFGVPVFFVLSGFLISFLILKEQETSSSFSIKKFYIRRILRIWPVYYMVIIFGFFIFPILRTYFLNMPTIENANFINYFFFLSNFDQISNNALPFGVGLGPTWSVGVEEQFYLIWPVFLMLFPKRKFIYPIIVLMIVSIISSKFFNLAEQNTLFCFIYLTSGALFAYLSFYYMEFIHKIVSINSIWFIIAITVIIFLIQYGVNSVFKIPSVLLIAIIIGYSIVFQCFSGKLSLNKLPLIERLGKYTYGLYLYHSICVFVIHTLMYDVIKVKENTITVVLISPVLSLFLSILISYCSYRFIESYFLSLKNKFTIIKS